MARSHVARHRPGQAPAGVPAARPARLALRLMAVATAGVCAALPLLAGQADAQQAAQGTAVTAPLAVTVTSVNPAYAKQGHRVTISGLVKNLSGSAASGLSVQLLSSTTRLGSRQDLEAFAAGTLTPAQFIVSTPKVSTRRLNAGQTWRWTVSFPARSLGVNCFGVYPLTVQVSDSALQTAHDAVPLPYWPAAKPATCPGQTRPRPFAISWIWPLIDTPHQGACAGLIGDRLAAAIAPAGRLGYLLATGSRYAASAGLTWAIDPALLDSVRAMKQPYQVGASARCRAGRGHPADPNAASWLASLQRATAGRPVFVTPYADVDEAALILRGNNADLGRSFADGDQVAHEILGREAVPARLRAGRNQLSSIAWPPGGVASRVMLNFFATRGIGAVVLASPAIPPPVRYTPGAVTSTLTGIGKKQHILLADRSITALLGSKAAASASPGSILSVRQLYLAETAMIAAEQPGRPRPVVVAPPRRWHPSRSLASDLLAETVHAPWLKPSTVGQLVAMKPSHIYKKLTQAGSSGQISKRLLRDVSKLDHQIELLQSIRVNPDPALDRAIFGIESSSWRGKGAKNATAMLARTTRYVESQLRGLSIRSGGGRNVPYHVTFGGKTSTVNVAIRSKLHYPVDVGLLVQAKKAQVTGVLSPIRVPALSSAVVKLTVHVKANQGKITLRLIPPNDSPLACHRPSACHLLPASPLIILVHPTDFGTVALVIIAVALAVFVIASASRAIRNGRPIPPVDSAQTAADHPAPPDPAEPGSAPSQPPGQSPESSGFADLGNRPEHIDSVGSDRSDRSDRSELEPAGPALTDQEPAAPSRRATEERT